MFYHCAMEHNPLCANSFFFRAPVVGFKTYIIRLRVKSSATVLGKKKLPAHIDFCQFVYHSAKGRIRTLYHRIKNKVFYRCAMEHNPLYARSLILVISLSQHQWWKSQEILKLWYRSTTHCMRASFMSNSLT